MGLKTSLLRDDKNLVIPLIVVAMTWRGAGGTVLIYLSAMQSIDNSLYEAVRIDGGGLMKRFRYVTLPHLKGTITSYSLCKLSQSSKFSMNLWLFQMVDQITHHFP